MIIQRGFRVRIYPSEEQAILINKTLGCCRFIYNKMLAERKEVYENLKDNKEELYKYKYKTEKEYKEKFEWLKEVDSTALQQSRRNLKTAYNNFFRTLKSNKHVGFPKFKKKRNEEAYKTVMNLGCNFENRVLILPKLKEVKFRHRKGEKSWYHTSRLISIVVRKTPTGKYFASCLFEGEQDYKGISKEIKKVKGLDCSMQNFYVDEQGNSPKFNRNYRQLEKKLAKLERHLSRKSRGGYNYEKQRIKVAKIHERITNKRKDFIDQLSWKLVQENDCIVVEDLNLKGISQGFNLGKSVHDLGYFTFVTKLIYKAKWNDKIVLQADTYFASSKTCNICNSKKEDLKLSDKIWTCPTCGSIHHRDINAALNLQKIGINLGKDVPLMPMEVDQVTVTNEIGNSLFFRM